MRRSHPRLGERADSRADSPVAETSYRADIDGLRAVAVLLVVIYHAGITRLSGGYTGVDVFYVISGFLITGLLADEVRRTGAISMRRFMARRMRRLLPAATLVLATTTIAALLVLPPIDLPSTMRDIVSAATWTSNWHFAAESTDYMNGVDRSPVLHYWSLSVEEQFYIVWPLLFIGATMIPRRRVRAIAGPRLFGIAVLVVGLVSFAISATRTTELGPWAYFGLHTRAWELAAGALLALLAPRVARLVHGIAREIAAIVGVVLVAVGAVVFGADTVFPGVAAAVPVIGTLLLLASAGSLVARGLSWRPVVALGKVSYGWYLWHWPAIWLAGVLTVGSDRAGADGDILAVPWWTTAIAVVGSLGLAVATYFVVEQPVRRSAQLRARPAMSIALGASLAAGVVGLATVVGVAREDVASAGVVSIAVLPASATVQDGATSSAASASSLPETDPETMKVRLKLSPAAAAEDRYGLAASCWLSFAGKQAARSCLFGDPQGKDAIVLIGDSHAAQWFPAFDAIARNRHLRLYVWAKGRCPLADVPAWLDQARRPYDECTAWRSSVMRRVAELHDVRAVILGRSQETTRYVLDGDGPATSSPRAAELWLPGLAKTIDKLHRTTPLVVLLRDTPWSPTRIAACVSKHLPNVSTCDFPLTPAADRDSVLAQAEESVAAPGSIVPLDLTTVVCPTDPCRAVTPDGYITYADDNHLTASYVGSLAGAVDHRLEQAGVFG